tara:strand:- start:1692 stop:1982 length:291 start_codon:yes stop_codon:yes gene_type:complete
MNRTSKKIVAASAGILNRHVGEESAASKLLSDHPEVLELVNEVLCEVAEGGRIVAAVETDGSLVGFVSKIDVPVATPKPPAPGQDIPDSPDADAEV